MLMLKSQFRQPGFSVPAAGESYSAAGVNYERLQEEVMAAGAADNTSNTKEMTPMPSTATEPVAAAAGATATATGKRETALNRDDMMYFSI
jgi:hypothetical protein